MKILKYLKDRAGALHSKTTDLLKTVAGRLPSMKQTLKIANETLILVSDFAIRIIAIYVVLALFAVPFVFALGLALIAVGLIWEHIYANYVVVAAVRATGEIMEG